MSNNSQDFKPYIKEKNVTVIITQREAVLLTKLRKYPFGKFVVHKASNILVRLEINDSQLIEEDTETNLE